MSIRVVVVDDDPLVRSGLGLILGGAADIEVVGQGENGEQALALAATERPDVVLMDIRMPVLDGLEATERLCGDRDAADTAAALPRVIVLTTFGADEYVVRALTAGASGFLLKDTPPREIVDAVRTVARGEPMLSPQALGSLIRQLTERATPQRSAADRSTSARRALATLTDREREVADAVGRGLSNAEIARELYLSVPTVKAHVSRLLDKLGVENRVRIAILVHEAQTS